MEEWKDDGRKQAARPTKGWVGRIALVVASVLAVYLTGFLTHPLLFPSPAADSAAAQDQAPVMGEGLAQRPSEKIAQGPSVPQLESRSIEEAYQRIVRVLSALAEKDGQDPELKASISRLANEVEKLRILNPYYRFKEIKGEAIPQGVPQGYGEELSVSFDRVQESIDILAPFGPTYGENKIILMGEELESYIAIGRRTACKYCCSAETLVREDGSAACGCAHSQAMRGLAAYLIERHREHLTDEGILEELNRWRASFFPKQTLVGVLREKQEDGEPGIEEILEEFPEFLPLMVGGC